MNDKYPRNQELYDEINEYTAEIRAEARRKNRKLVSKIIVAGFTGIIALLFAASLIHQEPAKARRPSIVVGELTDNPVGTLLDSAIKTAQSEKTASENQMYIVTVRVDPL